MYKIKCMVSGGVTGTRFSVLKGADGKEREFESFEDAEVEATRLNKEMNSSRAVASFRYWAE